MRQWHGPVCIHLQRIQSSKLMNYCGRRYLRPRPRTRSVPGQARTLRMLIDMNELITTIPGPTRQWRSPFCIHLQRIKVLEVDE